MTIKKKRLLVIDANSLIHRAFHALPPLSTSKGEMVNAVYGFLLVFFKALKELQPDYIAAAFDYPAPTKREKKFELYKAQRKRAPDELYSQIPKVKEILSPFHVPFYEKEGFEADDVIGTISKKAPKLQIHPPLETIILSGDLDTLQLIDENTRVSTLRKGIQDSVLYNLEKVKERFGGLKPEQLRDWKGLRGDPSDNIPGVRGIGEKTATKLLSEQGSLENLYDNLESANLSPKLKGRLFKEKDIAFLSRELATIATNVPLTLRLSDLAWKGFDQKKAQEILQRFEFRTLIPRLQELTEAKETLFQETTEEKIKRLYQEGVLSKEAYELEIKLIPVLEAMEQAGIEIDKPYFLSLSRELAEELKRLELEIAKKAGGPFNVNSPKQLSEVLFERLQLSFKGLRKTNGGVISTASPELEKLKGSHPVVERVLEYRELAKLHNTYTDPLPSLADKNSRVHTHFDQLGAATGRLSSSSPNLQNIPAQGEWGERIRKGFVAKKGFHLVSFDYSQIELRIAALLAKEERMVQFFKQGRDIHRETAAVVFGKKLEEVTREMRYKAKALNFGVLYGMGARGFSQAAGVSFEDAQDFIDNYFVQFPKIAAYIEETKTFAREHGYVETLFGRRRYLPDINSQTPQMRAGAERIAVNAPIQGSAADIIKIAMINLFQGLSLQRKDCRMLLQIHDELLFEIQDDKIKELVDKIKDIMESAASLKVRLLVRVAAGSSWGTLTSLL